MKTRRFFEGILAYGKENQRSLSGKFAENTYAISYRYKFLMPKGKMNKRYTPEFKIKVVETMKKEKLSCCEAARQFDISDHKRVASWERIYLEEGAEGLQIERRGRKSTGRQPKLKKQVEEDLIAEVQRLRAENAYLKKLIALVAERVRQEKKHK